MNGIGSIRMVVAAGLLLAACGEPVIVESSPSTSGPLPAPEPPAIGPQEELGAARQRWEAAGIDAYRYVFADDCGECDHLGPRELVVWEGEVLELEARSPTVEEIFDTIERAIEAGRSTEVTFHPELGYPTDVWIDREARAYDGGTHWIVSDLYPGLPGEKVALAEVEAAWELWRQTRPAAYEFVSRFLCDCSLAGQIWTRVDGDRIDDWQVEFDGEGGDVSPITIDQMFDDLVELMAAEGGLTEGGVRFSGSARFHPDLGYPIWLGLDIEVLDPDSQLSHLPPRLVFEIGDLVPVEGDRGAEPSELDAARLRWANSGLSDYTYRLTVHDIAAGTFSDPYTVTVSDQQVVSLEPAVEDVPAYAIDVLFEAIELWSQPGSQVGVLYHEDLGYPVFVGVYPVDTDRPPIAFSIDELTAA